jgi:hypothetical protein
VDAYRQWARIFLLDLHTLDCRLSATHFLVDNISAVAVKDKALAREVRTAPWNRVAHFEREPVSINVLNDADDSGTFKPNLGEV